MPYVVVCTNCKRGVVLGSNDPARNCNCGLSCHNPNFVATEIYMVCALDGSKIVKKTVTLADILSPESVRAVLVRNPKLGKPP